MERAILFAIAISPLCRLIDRHVVASIQTLQRHCVSKQRTQVDPKIVPPPYKYGHNLEVASFLVNDCSWYSSGHPESYRSRSGTGMTQAVRTDPARLGSQYTSDLTGECVVEVRGGSLSHRSQIMTPSAHQILLAGFRQLVPQPVPPLMSSRLASHPYWGPLPVA